jgi:hypothetical protein
MIGPFVRGVKGATGFEQTLGRRRLNYGAVS